MKIFIVEGWYRYSGGNEKDYEIETIECKSSIDALIKFKELYFKLKFFKITVKEL
jgi:hypothetical protein